MNNQHSAIWRNLISNKTVPASAARTEEGFLDLSGLHVNQPVVTGAVKGFPFLKRLSNMTQIKNVIFEKIDFSNAKLDNLRFFDCSFDECRFDRASCTDWRIWGTSIIGSSFNATNLRGSGLGSDQWSSLNRFVDNDYTKTDLRDCAFFKAIFTDCRFTDAKLKEVDFSGSIFTRCVFKGLLDEVIFQQYSAKGEPFPPNEMLDVDFSDATLENVEFRWLDMGKVIWPKGPEHIIIHDYKNKLSEILDHLKNRNDLQTRTVHAIIEQQLERAGNNQKTGYFNLQILDGYGNPELTREIVALIAHDELPRTF